MTTKNPSKNPVKLSALLDEDEDEDSSTRAKTEEKVRNEGMVPLVSPSLLSRFSFSFCLCFNLHCLPARKLTFPFIVASFCAIFKRSKSGRIFFKVQPSILKTFLFPGVQNKRS